MAGHAAVSLLRSVFKQERSNGLGVALAADGVLRGRGACLTAQRRAVLVVALGTAYQALVHAMVEGPREFGLLFGVAAVADLRLRSTQQRARLLGVVHRVAVEAGDVGIAMR